MRPLKANSNGIFSNIFQVEIPQTVSTNLKTEHSAPFTVRFKANGKIPFPQVIFRSNDGEHIFKGDVIKNEENNYSVQIPKDELPRGTHTVLIEGCKKEEWWNSGGDDWVKWFGEIKVEDQLKKKLIL